MQPNIASSIATIMLATVFSPSASKSVPQKYSAALATARNAFEKSGYGGSIDVFDTVSGERILSYSTGLGPGSVPLSTTKLLLAAAYLDLVPDEHSGIRGLISQGSDSEGRALATRLRRSAGTVNVLRKLRTLGFPQCSGARVTNCTTLVFKTPEQEWANAWSLGEVDFRVTPSSLTILLAACANEGTVRGRKIVSARTAKLLREAMRETVTSGTAKSIKDSLGTLGAIGGKTGTGPGPSAEPPADGVFAGLIFDDNETPRYSFTTWVRRGGRGGGIAADITAATARSLLFKRAGV